MSGLASPSAYRKKRACFGHPDMSRMCMEVCAYKGACREDERKGSMGQQVDTKPNDAEMPSPVNFDEIMADLAFFAFVDKVMEETKCMK